MRLLLVDPPFYRFMGYYTRYFPYGLAAIAAHARTLGHQPLIYDADHDPGARGVDYQDLPRHYPTYLRGVADRGDSLWDELAGVLKSTRPDWVGITALTAKMASVMQTATVVRQLMPNVPIVIGGPHAMVRPLEILANAPEADAVIVGEGESVLHATLVDDRAALDETADVPGVVTRSSARASEAPPADLESLTYPTRDCLLGRAYAKEDVGLMMASRGCPYRCTYCFRGGLWRRQVRFVPLETLEAELRELRRRGVRHVTFKDDVFTLNRDRTLSICRLLADHRLTWDCVTRADRLDEDLLGEMKRRGCMAIKIGVETGSPRTMQRLDRGLSPETIRDTAALMRKLGIHWTAYFMMGLPGERLDEVEETYRFMRDVKPDFASLSGYEAFPGTALFDYAVAHGIARATMTRDEFFRTNPHDYYLIRDDRGMILPSGTSYADVESAMHGRFHRYNSSLPRLAKRLRSRVGVWRGEPLTMVRDALRLTRWLRPRKIT